MIATEEHVDAPPSRVYDVIADPEWYPDWLVGAQHIRAVDESWPEPGAAFHHVVGVGPLHIRGRTSVVDRHAPGLLELRAGMGPLGTARVRFTIEPDEDGTRLTIEEEPEKGVVRLLWSTPARPLLGLGLWGRNAVSVKALRDRIEQTRDGAPGAT
jgi:carbon monoxide dehydrogenase subunit G